VSIKILASAVRASTEKTLYYPVNDYPPFGTGRDTPGKVTVSCRKTFEVAMQLKAEHPDAKVTVLNFASATNPGGGVTDSNP
jgi:uncharacterized protein (TIGR02452 family)